MNRDVCPFDDVSSDHNLFCGARVERHVLGANELAAYWSRFTNHSASFLTVRGRERRDVWDILRWHPWRPRPGCRGVGGHDANYLGVEFKYGW